jgi:hypothetical protein
MFVALGSLAAAQTNTKNGGLEGMRGDVKIIPNPALRQTIVALNSANQLNATSSQIVFALQGEFTKAPAAWSGKAKVLVGYGILVVAPLDSQDGAPISVFKFSSQAIPDSINDWKMDAYSVFGIARFGEKVPLTEDQIDEFGATGKYTRINLEKVDQGELRPRADSLGLSRGPGLAAPDLGVKLYCDAGGAGSTSCSLSGSIRCSVTCGPGYYSCCIDGTCTCVKNSN